MQREIRPVLSSVGLALGTVAVLSLVSCGPEQPPPREVESGPALTAQAPDEALDEAPDLATRRASRSRQVSSDARASAPAEEAEEALPLAEPAVTVIADPIPQVDAMFDSTNSNDVIGLGAGAGGNFGGKVGRRGQPGLVASAVRAPAGAESYASLVENGYHDAADAPLSTFALDVDTASYTNVRRFLREGRLPPEHAVRVEELINAFDYTDPAPAGEHPFGVVTEVAPAPWRPEHLLLRVGLAARPMPRSELPPSNLVLLVDVSGSMQSEDKLPLLKRSLRLLVEQLDNDDRLAMVVYAGAAGLVLPSTPCDNRFAILDAIEQLSAGGSTAGGAGLQLAYDQVREHFVEGGINRVILCTDGDFNVGPSSDAEMVALIEARREEGAFLTVLGFGTGNLKDSKMEQLADHGNGQYAYVDSFLEARRVFVEQLGGTLLTLAKDVKLQVEFNPARVSSYRLIGYENRLLAARDFNDDRKDAGELGAGHSVVALYELVPVGVDSDLGGVDPLRYKPADEPEPAPARPGEHDDELLFVKLRYKQPDGETSQLLTHAVRDTTATPSVDLRFAAAVAAFGMLLRDSPHCRDFDYDDVLDLARDSRGDDPHGRRGEFLGLVEVARTL